MDGPEFFVALLLAISDNGTVTTYMSLLYISPLYLAETSRHSVVLVYCALTHHNRGGLAVISPWQIYWQDIQVF